MQFWMALLMADLFASVIGEVSNMTSSELHSSAQSRPES